MLGCIKMLLFEIKHPIFQFVSFVISSITIELWSFIVWHQGGILIIPSFHGPVEKGYFDLAVWQNKVVFYNNDLDFSQYGIYHLV